VALPDCARVVWAATSRRRRNDGLIYPDLRSSEPIAHGELHDIIFKVDTGHGKGTSARKGGLFIKIGKAETIPRTNEQPCYGMYLNAPRETIVKPIVIAQEFVRAGVASAVSAAVGLYIQQIGCRPSQLDLEIFCDVDGYHLRKHKIIEIYGPVDGIILVIESMSGIEQLRMRPKDPFRVGGKKGADMEAGPGAAINGRGVGDIGEVQSGLDANADGMVFLFWSGLIGRAGLLGEQGERQEYDQGADDPWKGDMGLHVFFCQTITKQSGCQ